MQIQIYYISKYKNIQELIFFSAYNHITGEPENPIRLPVKTILRNMSANKLIHLIRQHDTKIFLQDIL